MLQVEKQALEQHYQVKLTDNDYQTMLEEMDGMTWRDIEDDTRLFEGIKSYVAYVYYDMDSCRQLLNLLTDLAVEDPNVQYKPKELLLGDEAVELDKNKILFIMG